MNYIIFLDLDGVLTPCNYLKYIHNKFVNEDNSFHYRNILQRYIFSEDSVKCLNYLYDKCKYSIVLSSTRRYEFSLEQWNFIFDINQIKPNIIGVTPASSNCIRQDEITSYINKHNCKLPFIVIDDDTFDLEQYKDVLIYVNGQTGLTLDYMGIIQQKLKEVIKYNDK